MPPRALAAPLHRNSREDEYSFVLEGRVGALLGDDVVYGGPGDLIFKPRGQWHPSGTTATRRHASWRSSRRQASSGTFEDVVELLCAGPPEPSALAAIAARYGLEVDRESIPRLTEEYRLRFGPAAR
jgi:hypothetical protein